MNASRSFSWDLDFVSLSSEAFRATYIYCNCSRLFWEAECCISFSLCSFDSFKDSFSLMKPCFMILIYFSCLILSSFTSCSSSKILFYALNLYSWNYSSVCCFACLFFSTFFSNSNILRNLSSVSALSCYSYTSLKFFINSLASPKDPFLSFPDPCLSLSYSFTFFSAFISSW